MDGLQRQLLYLGTGLDRERFPPTVALSEASALVPAFDAAAIEHLPMRMSSWRSIFRFPARIADARDLLRLARQKRARLIHAQDVWRAGYARYIGSRLAVPTIVHVRGPLAPRDIRKHCLDRVDALIPIARRYADDLAAAGVDPARITIIDDAVDLRLFSRERAASGFLSRRFGVGEELKVGIVGRITPFKQIDAFVKAVAALPPALYARARFLVVGAWAEPEYRQTIESYVSRLGLGSKVTFLGRIEDEIPSLLADLDLLVTFSGGSVMFEAMAMGTPVLSVRSDARHSEHTRHGETAWCVVTDAVADASQALAHLLRDRDLRHRLGEAGSAYVRDHLSVSAMVTKTEALYERLLRAGS